MASVDIPHARSVHACSRVQYPGREETRGYARCASASAIASAIR